MEDKKIIASLNIACQALSKTLVEMCEGDQIKLARVKDFARINHQWFEENPDELLLPEEILSRKL